MKQGRVRQHLLWTFTVIPPSRCGVTALTAWSKLLKQFPSPIREKIRETAEKEKQKNPSEPCGSKGFRWWTIQDSNL